MTASQTASIRLRRISRRNESALTGRPPHRPGDSSGGGATLRAGHRAVVVAEEEVLDVGRVIAMSRTSSSPSRRSSGLTSPRTIRWTSCPVLERTVTPGRANAPRRGRPAEDQVHRSRVVADEGGDGGHLHEPAFADDRDPVAGTFHLGQVVRREEDRPPVGPRLGHEGQELALHERVEAGRRLVHDQQRLRAHEDWTTPTFWRLPRDSFLSGRVGSSSRRSTSGRQRPSRSPRSAPRWSSSRGRVSSPR